jgi:carboxymethylenebutenolidase
MPVYHPDRIEHSIVNGRIHIAQEDGQQISAYWSHPTTGDRFPGVVLIHDWWGLTMSDQHLANLFAQTGYYVIIPDLYKGKVATTPEEAIPLLKSISSTAFKVVNTALDVLEQHHRCNAQVAAVGIGMGGSLAFEAALRRNDLEGAIAYCGFPQSYFGKFKTSPTPILAIYGEDDPHVNAEQRERLRAEFAISEKPHQLVVMEKMGRDLFSATEEYNQVASKQVWKDTLSFLDQHLGRPPRQQAKKAY